MLVGPAVHHPAFRLEVFHRPGKAPLSVAVGGNGAVVVGLHYVNLAADLCNRSLYILPGIGAETVVLQVAACEEVEGSVAELRRAAVVVLGRTVVR